MAAKVPEEVKNQAKDAFDQIKTEVAKSLEDTAEIFRKKIEDTKIRIETTITEVAKKQKELSSAEMKTEIERLSNEGTEAIVFLTNETMKIVNNLIETSKGKLQMIYQGAKVMFGDATALLDSMMKDLEKFLDEFLKKTQKSLQETSENCQKQIKELAKKTTKSVK